MADVGARPINVHADELMKAATSVAGHLEVSAKPPTSVVTHPPVVAAPVDAAATGAAEAIQTKIATLSTELAGKGPAIHSAGAAAAGGLLAQDALNANNLPSVPTASPGGAASSIAGRGAQMMGMGLGGLAPPPQAPQPAPPPPPPPRPTGPPPHVPDPRIRHMPPPSWTRPAPAEDSPAARRAYDQIIQDIKDHNAWRPDSSNQLAVQDYNDEAAYLNATKASLEDQLNGWKSPYDPSGTSADKSDAPLGTPAENSHTPTPPSIKDAPSGGPRRWNPDLRSPEPETTYNVDGGREVFHTDQNGLTDHVDIRLDGPQQPGPDSSFRPPGMQPGDHAGHLVPKRFGGPGEEINLTAQQGTNVNLSQVKVIENEWAKILEQTHHLDASIEIVRDVTGRPIEYIYDWQPLTGPRRVEIIENH